MVACIFASEPSISSFVQFMLASTTVLQKSNIMFALQNNSSFLYQSPEPFTTGFAPHSFVSNETSTRIFLSSLTLGFVPGVVAEPKKKIWYLFVAVLISIPPPTEVHMTGPVINPYVLALMAIPNSIPVGKE